MKKTKDEGTMKEKMGRYVYGVNIDLVVPGVSSRPKPGQEDEVPVMDTMACCLKRLKVVRIRYRLSPRT